MDEALGVRCRAGVLEIHSRGQDQGGVLGQDLGGIKYGAGTRGVF